MVGFTAVAPLALREVAARHMLNIFHGKSALIPFLHNIIRTEIDKTSMRRAAEAHL